VQTSDLLQVVQSLHVAVTQNGITKIGDFFDDFQKSSSANRHATGLNYVRMMGRTNTLLDDENSANTKKTTKFTKSHKIRKGDLVSRPL